MVLNRADESIPGKKFSDIAQFFKKGDCLVVNETKVFPARLFGRKEKTNAKIEVFLLRELNKEENDLGRDRRPGQKGPHREQDLLRRREALVRGHRQHDLARDGRSASM